MTDTAGQIKLAEERLDQTEERVDKVQAVLDEVRRVLVVAEKAEAAAERARAGLRAVKFLVIAGSLIVAAVVVASRRGH